MMKKLACILTFVFIISGSLLNAAANNIHYNPTPVSEQFDKTALTGWRLDTTGGSVSVQTVDYDEKLVFKKWSPKQTISATRNITEPDGQYLIEADMWADATALIKLEAVDADGNVLFLVQNNGSAIGVFI